jgi:hypothetical protein
MRKFRTAMLLQSQIETAMKVTRSNRAAAEYLRVSFNMYKRYAQKYTNSEGIPLYTAHKNQAGRGVLKGGTADLRTKVDDILLGKHPTYPTWKLFRRLLQSGYIEESCKSCGFHQKRPTDLRTPLLLNHIDRDKTNHRFDNLEVLCYNCYFILVGNIKNAIARGEISIERPEQYTSELFDRDQDTIEALSGLDLLTDEEKQAIIDNLSNL